MLRPLSKHIAIETHVMCDKQVTVLQALLFPFLKAIIFPGNFDVKCVRKYLSEKPQFFCVCSLSAGLYMFCYISETFTMVYCS